MIWKYVSPGHTRAKAAARPTWNFKEARKNCNGFLLSLVASRQLEGELELRDDVLNTKTEGALIELILSKHYRILKKPHYSRTNRFDQICWNLS